MLSAANTSAVSNLMHFVMYNLDFTMKSAENSTRYL